MLAVVVGFRVLLVVLLEGQRIMERSGLLLEEAVSLWWSGGLGGTVDPWRTWGQEDALVYGRELAFWSMAMVFFPLQWWLCSRRQTLGSAPARPRFAVVWIALGLMLTAGLGTHHGALHTGVGWQRLVYLPGLLGAWLAGVVALTAIWSFPVTQRRARGFGWLALGAAVGWVLAGASEPGVLALRYFVPVIGSLAIWSPILFEPAASSFVPMVVFVQWGRALGLSFVAWRGRLDPLWDLLYRPPRTSRTPRL